MVNIVKKSEVAELESTTIAHILNDQAIREDISLGDIFELTTIGVHLVIIPPGKYASEEHRHHYEDEFICVLNGSGTLKIDDKEHIIDAGDYIGLKANAESHQIHNDQETYLELLVIGARLNHEIVDFPKNAKTLFINKGKKWQVVDNHNLKTPYGNRTR